ncbi:S-adenosylmethionine decarboxylase [Candidatus Woesearchaeota archaeon]|nr:S-adenosylmethionine decarboxylase [Candidatus Woesearchaeota archaeon]
MDNGFDIGSLSVFDRIMLNNYKRLSNNTGPLFGLWTGIDLYSCDPAAVNSHREESRSTIEGMVADLCMDIDMKRFGETIIVGFGNEPRVSGYSMMQLIETSLVSGHFVDMNNSAYIDIFSCKPYPPEHAAMLCKDILKAEHMELEAALRGYDHRLTSSVPHTLSPYSTEITCTLHGISHRMLEDNTAMRNLFLESLFYAEGFTIEQVRQHRFPGEGLSITTIISESGSEFHTNPSLGSATYSSKSCHRRKHGMLALANIIRSTMPDSIEHYHQASVRNNPAADPRATWSFTLEGFNPEALVAYLCGQTNRDDFVAGTKARQKQSYLSR